MKVEGSDRNRAERKVRSWALPKWSTFSREVSSGFSVSVKTEGRVLYLIVRVHLRTEICLFDDKLQYRRYSLFRFEVGKNVGFVAAHGAGIAIHDI
jgi:hypothetical protein